MSKSCALRSSEYRYVILCRSSRGRERTLLGNTKKHQDPMKPTWKPHGTSFVCVAEGGDVVGSGELEIFPGFVRCSCLIAEVIVSLLPSRICSTGGRC
jgi:hypothetical protein